MNVKSIGSGGFGRTCALAAGLLLVGCRVGPDAEVPDLSAELPAAFAADAVLDRGRPSAPVVLDAWWERFGDRELARLVWRATSESLDLRRLAEAVRRRAGEPWHR